MNTLSIDPKELFTPYLKEVEPALKQRIDEMGPDSRLKEACAYSLLNGGKRYRPAVVLMIAKAIGKGYNAMDAALGVEFFHTASLIADDLPCMDNDDFRRECPSLHKHFDEATALLASYTLIAEGYRSIGKNAERLKLSGEETPSYWDRVGLIALENTSFNGGLEGITAGQYEDIYPNDLELSTLLEAIRKKTVTLFEISFVQGWLFGGGEISLLEPIKRAAYHLGMAFQISDDFGDTDQDKANERKVNLPNVVGREKAEEMFHVELSSYLKILEQLRIEHAELSMLGKLLIGRLR